MAEKKKPDPDEPKTAIVKMNSATAELLANAEDIFVTAEDIAEIKAKFTHDVFVKPYEIPGADAGNPMLLKFLTVEPFKLRTGKEVNMVRASIARNPRVVLRFLESGGMRGNFTDDRVGLKFALTFTGMIETGQPQPCAGYSFAWEQRAK